jgi:hypothetical protein
MSTAQRRQPDPFVHDDPFPASDWRVPVEWELTPQGMSCLGWHAIDYQIGVDRAGQVIFRDAYGEHEIPPVPDEWFLCGGLGPHWAYQQITQQYGAPIGQYGGETVADYVRLCRTLLWDIYDQLMPPQTLWPMPEIEPLDEATARAQVQWRRDEIRKLRDAARRHRGFAEMYANNPAYPFPDGNYLTIEEHLARAEAIEAEVNEIQRRFRENPVYPYTLAPGVDLRHR